MGPFPRLLLADRKAGRIGRAADSPPRSYGEGGSAARPAFPRPLVFRYAPGAAHPRQKTNRHASLSHAHCGALRHADVGQPVRLSGWCHRIRDHGGVLFIDLRDHYGLTQCVVDPDSPAFEDAEKLRSEFVVRFDGTVRKRPPGTENPEMPTGLIELYVQRDRGARPGRRTAAARFRRPALSRGHPAQVPLSRPASREAASQHHAARASRRFACARG